MPIENQDFVLYLLVRKDMASLCHAGKMMAQCAHAANHAASEIGSNKFGAIAMSRFAAWEKSTPQHFGTTIVYGGIVAPIPGRSGTEQRVLRIDDIQTIVEHAKLSGHPAGIVTDPTYPLTDGQVVHAFPCQTVGWMFGLRKELAFLTDYLILHPSSNLPASTI